LAENHQRDCQNGRDRGPNSTFGQGHLHHSAMRAFPIFRLRNA
jgi:hypothetical protein